MLETFSRITFKHNFSTFVAWFLKASSLDFSFQKLKLLAMLVEGKYEEKKNGDEKYKEKKKRKND